MFESPSQRTSHEQGTGWVYITELENMANWLCDGDEASGTFRAATSSMDTFRGPAMVKRWIHALTTFEFETEFGGSSFSDTIERMVEGRRVRVPVGVAFETEVAARLAVMEQLAGLPDNYRCALLLKEGQGLSVERTAKVMGVSPASLRSVLYRARRALRSG